MKTLIHGVCGAARIPWPRRSWPSRRRCVARSLARGGGSGSSKRQRSGHEGAHAWKGKAALREAGLLDLVEAAAALEPKTPAAPSCNCAFHAVIWCGCTSNSLASSASVFSPLIAANATFALKPGLCVRRVRFVMFAPDPRQHRRCQAGNLPTGLSEFPEPSLLSGQSVLAPRLSRYGFCTVYFMIKYYIYYFQL